MIVLDNNVVSALMMPDTNQGVVNWLDRQPATAIWITAVTLLETRTGLLMLPDGRRKAAMTRSFDSLVSKVIADRILPFDQKAAETAAVFSSIRIRTGKNIKVPDTLIAAIVISQSATLATRNIKDFNDLDIRLVNPWDA